MFLIEYIKKYKLTYLSVLAVFVVGIVIGMFVTFKIPASDKKEIRGLCRIFYWSYKKWKCR